VIHVEIKDDEGRLLGRVQIERLNGVPDRKTGNCEYVATMGWEGLDEAKVIRRSFFHPRFKRNVMNLVFEALFQFEEKEFDFEREADPSDLERRFQGTLPTIQGWKS
jgi:hypothetical protein